MISTITVDISSQGRIQSLNHKSVASYGSELNGIVISSSFMDSWIYDILSKGIKGELKDNELSYNLYRLAEQDKLSGNNRREIANALLSMKDNSLPSIEEREAQSEFNDNRFLYLGVRNLKKFPANANEKDVMKSPYYGVSFCKDNNPVSSVFLGANGSGKTSLYAALEFLGMGKANTALVRGYSKLVGETAMSSSRGLVADQSEFLVNAVSGLTQADIRLARINTLESCDNLREYSKKPGRVVPDTFYCSDYDVRQLEASRDYSLFFVNQLGLGPLYNMLQQLYYTRYYLDERIADYERERGTVTSSSKIDYELRALADQFIFGLTILKQPAKDYDEVTQSLSHSLYLQEVVEHSDLGIQDPNELEHRWMADSKRIRKEVSKLGEEDWYNESLLKIYGEVNQNISLVHDKYRCDFNQVDPITKEKMRDCFKRLLFLRIELHKRVQAFIKSPIDFEDKDLYLKRCDERMRKVVEANRRIDDFKPLEEKFERVVVNKELREKSIKELTQLIGFVENELTALLMGWQDKIEGAIRELLTNYFLDGDDNLNISFTFHPFEFKRDGEGKSLMDIESVDRIVEEFVKFRFEIVCPAGKGNVSGQENRPIHPRGYLNTFKFKLFCVAMKLALCCVAKKIYNMNYPLVIDDVFDASDFDNRISIKEFALEMVSQHDMLMCEDRYNLQIIFFTQDDLVASQMEKGLVLGCGRESVKFGHIFDYHQMDPSADTKIIVLPYGETMEYISVEDSL